MQNHDTPVTNVNTKPHMTHSWRIMQRRLTKNQDTPVTNVIRKNTQSKGTVFRVLVYSVMLSNIFYCYVLLSMVKEFCLMYGQHSLVNNYEFYFDVQYSLNIIQWLQWYWFLHVGTFYDVHTIFFFGAQYIVCNLTVPEWCDIRCSINMKYVLTCYLQWLKEYYTIESTPVKTGEYMGLTST